MKNKYVIFCAIIASLGGLLWGYDTAVISGAEKDIQQLFHLNDFQHGFTVSIALIGTLLGAFISNIPADRFGRKYSLLMIAVLYAISALGCGLSTSWLSLLVFRFMGGVGVGASSVIGPMYIAEISPALLRGRLVTVFQLNVVSGIVLSYFVNYLIASHIAHDAWRWMLGVQVVPATLFFALAWLIPFSPRWLIMKGRISEATEVIRKFGSAHAPSEVLEIQQSLAGDTGTFHERFFQKRYRMPILLALLVAVFNQLTGINAILLYTPRIFEMVGYAKDSALLQSVSVGITLLIFTVAGMFLIDRAGRKRLLLVGSIGMMVFLALVSHTIFSNSFSGGSNLLMLYLSGFIMFFSISQGTVIWVFISEIFPNSVRSKGQAFGSITHWLSATFISWMIPMVSGGTKGGWAFAFFAMAMAVQFIVVKRFFPETKGKSLEQIQKEMVN